MQLLTPGNGRTLKCNSYWNDDTSFVLDIGDGELVDKSGEPYFIHCEYNCDDGMWNYVFEIWFEHDSCSIYDILESYRDEYLSETEIEELRGIIYNLCKDEVKQELREEVDMIDKTLLKYIPKEYKKQIISIQKGDKVWNDNTHRWNMMIDVVWSNGENTSYQNASYMRSLLKEFGKN